MSIYELTKSQSKIWVEKYLNPFMEENDFKLKKSKNSDLYYLKKTDYGFQRLNLGFLNSWPGTKIEYAFFVRYERIEEIFDNTLVQLDSEYKVKKDSHSIGTSQGSFENKRTNSYMPEMVTEEEVKKSCDLVIIFLQKIGFSLAQRFSDIKELDKEINGENFWESDWQMPFTMGGSFPIKRIIISLLSNNPRFEDLIIFHINDMETKIKKGEYIEIHQKGLNKFLGSVKYIRDNFQNNL